VHGGVGVKAVEVAGRADEGGGEESIEAGAGAEIEDMFALIGSGVSMIGRRSMIRGVGAGVLTR